MVSNPTTEEYEGIHSTRRGSKRSQNEIAIKNQDQLNVKASHKRESSILISNLSDAQD